MFVYYSASLLTKSTTPIIGPISELLGIIINAIFNFVYSLTEMNSLGLSIIFFTIIVRLILLPLGINQQRSMKKMQKVQPIIQKIQNKYKGKKDAESQRKMQEELGAVYKENKVNPFGGCLPLIIQMPIFFALFNVLRNIPAYITVIGNVFNNIATKIMSINGYQAILANFTDGKSIQNYDPSKINSIIDLLSKFSKQEWTGLVQQIPVDIASNIEQAIQAQERMNYFLGISLAESPGLAFPGILLPLIAGLTTFLSTKFMSSNNNSDMNSTAAQTQKSMNLVFPFITAFMAYTLPAGLGLYWITSNLFQMGQQFLINKIYN